MRLAENLSMVIIKGIHLGADRRDVGLVLKLWVFFNDMLTVSY